jgi:hypothetical protein
MESYVKHERMGRGSESESRYMREMNEKDHSFPRENAYNMRHATGGYLTEDHSQVANLPQHVVYRPYGDPTPYLPQEQDDTITGIDRQKSWDMHQAMKHFAPKKV